MTYVDAKNQMTTAKGVEYAYRSTGDGADATPLVTLQHFRGNLDNWYPALIDALAQGRPVITFDNRGVAASTGTTPSTIPRWRPDAIDFIDALDVGPVDLLGSRSAASSPRRSLSFARRSCARSCSPPPPRREPAECTAGPRT